MWAIPTGSSWFCLKKKKKSPSPESRVPETSSDPPIGSGRDSGRDIFPQLRWTSTYNSHRRALLSRQTDELLPINHIDELFPRHRVRAPTIHIDELFPSTQMDELPLYTLTSPSLQLRWTGSFLLFVLMISSPQLRWTSSHIDELFPRHRWTSSHNSY